MDQVCNTMQGEGVVGVIPKGLFGFSLTQSLRWQELSKPA